METNESPSINPPEKPRRRRVGPFWANTFFLLLGIVLPAVALIVELLTKLCAENLFNPIPTPAHALLVALVPLGNFLIWQFHRRNRKAAAWLAMLNGAGLIVSAYYALLFIPILPVALMGLVMILYFGIGLIALLPMAPLFGFLAGLALRKRLRTVTQTEPGQRIPGLRTGLLVGCAALALLNGPACFHAAALRMALSKDASTSLRGIQWLRHGNSEPMLRRHAYAFINRPTDLFLTLAFAGLRPSTEQFRTIYYRVTGNLWNSKPLPETSGFFGRTTRDWVWDPGLGGDSVGAILPGLTLTDSRLDAVADAPSAIAYAEWTLVFHNDTAGQREARALIALPPGGVVSRLTLWVNGEPREAAFGGRSETIQAYKTVAVVQRRDPVLVTTRGPDTVLMQCFPIPPHGDMKIRLGITAPLRVDDPASAALLPPAIKDRNFLLAENLTHAFWLDANAPLSSECSSLKQEQPAKHKYTLRGPLSDAELRPFVPLAHLTRSDAPDIVWAADPQQPDRKIIQRLIPSTFPAPSRIALVLDGSASMKQAAPQLLETLRNINPNIPLDVLVSDDEGPHLLTDPDALRSFGFEGGRDNLAALTQAWDILSGDPSAWIVWVHGPIPVITGAAEGLQQRYERRGSGPLLVSVPLEEGADLITEKVAAFSSVVVVTPQIPPHAPIARLLAGEPVWLPAYQAVRTTAAADEPIPAQAWAAKPYLVDLWANDQIMDGLRNNTPRVNLVELAIRYHLVTPVSGAVVLETDRQYEENGLKPNEANQGHIVPEPGTFWLLLIVGLPLLILRKMRRVFFPAR